jgi:hypothetical protein
MTSMSQDPDRDRQAADEQRLRSLLAAVEAPAPPELRRAIIDRNAAHAPARRRRWTLPMPALALGLSGAASAACVALVLLLVSGSGAAAPTVARVALVALERPTAAPPAALVAQGTSIPFPDWTTRGWPSTGVRRDTLSGRRVTTEFYRSYDSGTLGYAIVAGTPLRWGAQGTTQRLAGERYGVIEEGGATVVTWVAEGHTCVLASRTASARALLELAGAQEHALSA